MHILVVDDDQAVRDSLARSLQYSGYEVSTASDGLEALAKLSAIRPEAVIMDVMMPRLDGLEATRMLRSTGNDVPILILTARDAVGDRVDGLDAGADDYMVKPFSPAQLVARIRAVMRRTGVSAAPTTLTVAGLALDRSRGEVVRLHDGASVRLTGLELKLLEALMLHPGQVLPSDTLITTVWGPEGGDRTMLKQLMYRLRSKIEADASKPVYIETGPGIGYALNAG